MNRPVPTKSATWLVWTLVAIGLLAGVITNGLFGWTLSKLQVERLQLVEEENRLVQAAAKLRRIDQEAREEINQLLQEGLPHTHSRAAIDDFHRRIKELRTDVSDDSVLTVLSSLELTVNDLETLWKKAVKWHRQFDLISEDISKMGTLQQVRDILNRMRSSLETLEGRERLREAIQIRQWRMAKGQEAALLAQKILDNRTKRSFRILEEADTELDDLGKEVEMLAGETQLDRLTDLKDNQLKPSIERLSRNLDILADESIASEELASQFVTSLKDALFGKGHIIDLDHQTITVGEGGLYRLRNDELHLKQERRALLSEAQRCYQQIELFYPELSNLIRERGQILAEQAENQLTKTMYNLLFLSILALAGFLALGWVISRNVQQQFSSLARLRRHNELILNSAGEGIIGMNNEGKITFLNPAGARMVGWEPEELIGKDQHAILHHSKPDGTAYPWGECPLCTVLKKGTTHQVESEVFWRKDGPSFPVQYMSTPIRNEWGALEGAVVMFLDISERKETEKILAEKEQHLHYLAHHDHLTNLPNRLLFHDRLRHAMDMAHRSKQQIALFFLDLDRFKNINDSLGHERGDQVLLETSRRLKNCLRDNDTVARLGGDEFVVVLENIDDLSHASNVAQKILSRVSQTIWIGRYQLYITASLGISIFPADAKDVEGLMKCADVAMYRAKEQGKDNFQFYTADMNARAHEMLLLENSMRKALEKEQFILHYQPQYDLAASHKLVGVEALLRWQHPDKGLLPPNEFISLAEESGLIVPIGEWALRNACAQNKKWQIKGYPPIQVAVNISVRQFRQTDLVKTVSQVLEETGLDPQFLELEITESMIMDEVERATSIMRQLNSMGVKLAIDDFGTGYSSLSHLKHFPISKLKIDQTFVRDVTTDPNDAAIAASVIALGQSMNLEIIAEGVETEEQLQFLRERKCALGQGFLFSPPLVAEEFEDFLGKYS